MTILTLTLFPQLSTHSPGIWNLPESRAFPGGNGPISGKWDPGHPIPPPSWSFYIIPQEGTKKTAAICVFTRFHIINWLIFEKIEKFPTKFSCRFPHHFCVDYVCLGGLRGLEPVLCTTIPQRGWNDSWRKLLCQDAVCLCSWFDSQKPLGFVFFFTPWKALTPTQADLHAFIDQTLQCSEEVKEELKRITPSNYTGLF